MKHTKKTVMALVVTCSLTAATAAAAFSDISNPQNAKIVQALQQQGVVSGVNEQQFAPSGSLTAAQGLQMIVNALKLQVEGTDQATVAKNDKTWYADAYEVAKANGIALSDAKPATVLTKEQFAKALYEGINATGQYPTIKMYIQAADEKQMNPNSMEAIQFLLLTKITSLDENQNFLPQQRVTRMEAAQMVYNAIEFVDRMNQPAESEPQPQPQPEPEEPVIQERVELSIEKQNDQQNKVILTRKDAPNPGYGIAVDHIEYVSDTEAVVYYKLLSPKPGEMNIQVITDTQTSTLVDSKYKVTIKPVAGTKLPQPSPGTVRY